MMTAIEEVRAKLEDSGLGGRVEKTHHKLLRGYWWFPDQGQSVYLGGSKEVALVAIDAEKYKAKRERDCKPDLVPIEGDDPEEIIGVAEQRVGGIQKEQNDE